MDYRQEVQGDSPKLMIVLEQRPTNFDIALATGNGFCIAYPAQGASFTVVSHEPGTG
jgi:hypothetical protein